MSISWSLSGVRLSTRDGRGSLDDEHEEDEFEQGMSSLGSVF